MSLKFVSKCLIPVLTVVWSAGLLAGSVWLIDHSSKPGEVELNIKSWPTETHLAQHSGKPQVLVFVHPMCSCSEVTLAEMSSLFQRLNTPCEISLVISTTDHTSIPENRVHGFETWCQQVGAHLVWDFGRSEARRFGVTTSGHVFLFSSDGNLQFQGGVTAGRGHHGENPGLSSLVELLTNTQPRKSSRDCFQTYGCPLFEDRS